MNATAFQDMSVLLDKYSQAYNVAGIIGLLAGLKIFKCVPQGTTRVCSSPYALVQAPLCRRQVHRSLVTHTSARCYDLETQVSVHFQEDEHAVVHPVPGRH